MAVFRLRRPNFFLFTLSTSLFNPLFFFVFIYFFTSSADLLNIYLLFFKVKLTNGIAFGLFFCLLLFYRLIQVPLRFFTPTLAILGCMILSMWNSPNHIANIGFFLFFLFSYFFYFLTPYNLFRVIPLERLLKIYSLSFYCVGFYALCQVLLSLLGIILPGVLQYIHDIARGQAFTYEPSFYALYMTPFTIYRTSQYILQKNPLLKKVKDIFWPNFFLLVSTSTGCFFSYLFFLLSIAVFKFFKIANVDHLSIKKLSLKFLLILSFVFALLWVTCKRLIVSGFLKFFYGGGTSHFSVQDRWRGLVEYFDIFLDHPLIGIGFGSGPFYLAQKKGFGPVNLLDPTILTFYSPMNVTTEVLASVGLLGTACFFFLLYVLFSQFRALLKMASLTQEEKLNLTAWAISICVMILTLQFSQSIMRSYLWIHIGMFCGFMGYLQNKFTSTEEIPQSRARIIKKD